MSGSAHRPDRVDRVGFDRAALVLALIDRKLMVAR